jgi:SAM-dependent methyltransferase
MTLRLSPTTLVAILQPWDGVHEPMQRRVAQLSEVAAGQEVLWVGCGAGAAALWWARKYRTHVAGVDPDPRAIEAADAAARGAGLAELATFQRADVADLPHEAQVFDIVVVNMIQLLGADGEAALREAARVARPMSTVIALVPSWLSTPDAADAGRLAGFGLTPRLVVEWKGACREAGLVELVVEEAVRDGPWIATGRLGLLVRGWRAARWAGLGAVLSPELRALRALVLRRVLGLSIIKGRRWAHT